MQLYIKDIEKIEDTAAGEPSWNTVIAEVTLGTFIFQKRIGQRICSISMYIGKWFTVNRMEPETIIMEAIYVILRNILSPHTLPMIQINNGFISSMFTELILIEF